MKLVIFLFLTISQIFSANCSLFLWSKKEFYVSPLKEFNAGDLSQLVGLMDHPKVVAFLNIKPNKDLLYALKDYVNTSFTGYTVNDGLLYDVYDTDAIILTGDVSLDMNTIEDEMEKFKYLNTLFLVVSLGDTNIRSKRENDEIMRKMTESQGPVAFIGKFKTDETYGIIYSSTPLLLRINKTDLYLAESEVDFSYVDTVPSEGITRLNVNKLMADRSKIMLRFIFSWEDSYWYLTSVRISGTSYNTTYVLAVDKEVSAPERFSYHCSGETVFSDSVNDVYLYLTNMQVQIDSLKESFDDAYDCVPFTTAPIWSGIFVSSLLIVVLMLSLMALWDIKTMDKFDNYKTKQLTITVNE